MDKVLIIMGSASDMPVVKECVNTLKKFGVDYEAHVISAHRTPEIAAKRATEARSSGFGVIIGAAGKAAHLPGVLAAYTTLPVIGLPIKSSTLDGMDSLLSIVQMPKGVPVATVAIDGAHNAALLAVQILAVRDGELADMLERYKSSMQDTVIADDEKIQRELNA